MSKELCFHNEIFETVVRHELSIYDRPILDTDIKELIDLDCSDFTFSDEDCEILMLCEKLELLYINIGADRLAFLERMVNLDKLVLETWNTVDFNYFSSLRNIRTLVVSGGDVSSIDFKNLEALEQLEYLEDLTLHEFGSADLRPLKKLPNLKNLYIGYANKLYNIDAISSLKCLETLSLISIDIDNFDFLDGLSADTVLLFDSLNVESDIDIEKFSRFEKCDYEDIGRIY